MIRMLGRQVIASLGDVAFNALSYDYLHKKFKLATPKLEFKAPRRFNHKIIWLKINYRNALAGIYADKIAVKAFAANVIEPSAIIPTLKIFHKNDVIDFADLPDQFVLKATHGSGWCILVRDKGAADLSMLKKQVRKWLNTNYYSLSREHQYRAIPRAVIVEPLIKSRRTRELMDFKFFCFNGEPRLVQVDIDRFSNHTRGFYDLSWKPLPFKLLYPAPADPVFKPTCLSDMISIARRLSSGFPFLRVDLYDYDGKPLLGELTLHPEGGFGPIIPDHWDERLGDMLNLPGDF